MTVAELSERELIARIQSKLPPAPPWLLVGVGDDAAVVEPERNRAEVLSVDALVEGVHFDRAFVPPDAIGHRALAVNLSDLAAMGAAPRLALLSMALPASLPLADFDGIVDGLTVLAREHRMHIVGGNLTHTSGPLTIDVTVVGTVKRRQALTRTGARPGDEIYVSGMLGTAAAGLRTLNAAPRTARTSNPNDAPRTANVERYLRPTPRVRLGLMLGRNRAASACVDLSDGLADGAHRIAEASGVGVSVDGDALPIDPAARLFFESQGQDPVTAAVTGGDDYELLFTVRPRTRRRLSAALRHGGAPLTRVGVCTEGSAVMLTRAGAESPMPPGYGHFLPAKTSRSGVEREPSGDRS
jgi:thiamine-monophosphate kinase